jgi:NAD+ kinase
MRLFIVANTGKPAVVPVLEELKGWLSRRFELVGVEVDGDYDLARVEADVMLLLGGDGTLLSAARRLEGRQIPLMGVNFGRLGFLASFRPRDIRRDLESLRAGELPVQSRMMVEASVLGPDSACDPQDRPGVARERRWAATALNDAVVTAGPPFRMIELEISADSQTGVGYFGDGVIVSTPSGSTAYNVSAGGPIISVNVDSMCITPICPHSLSFRPVVVSERSTVTIRAVRVNEGTTLFCDGQASVKLSAGERVVVYRSGHDVLLIENPDAREWRTLAEKLHWAISPRYNDRPVAPGGSPPEDADV